MQTILFKLKTALFFNSLEVYNYITVLNIMILLITQSHLSVGQASSTFEHLGMCTSMYTTSTFITEALRSIHLVTYVQLFYNDC